MKFMYPGGGDIDVYATMTAPNHKGIPAAIVKGGLWAGDLGCLNGPAYVKRIDFNRMAEWLPTMAPYRDRCLFLAGGDVVGNAAETLETYHEFSRYFDSWTLAYVAQNGAESLEIPPDCTAVFIGGDTEWKVSKAAVRVIKRAQVMGKHVHIGRVNWWQRYSHFRLITGSEDFTCDGTRQRFDGRENTLKAWNGYEAQLPLLQW